MGYEVDFIAVGEEKSGDAIVVRFGNAYGGRDEQTVIVIDGGYKESGEELVNHIKTHYRTDRIDLVISTHPDADHARGLEAVLEQCQIDCLWMHQPWNHTDDIAKMFRDGRVTDMSVKESLRKSLENARALEKLANSKGIPIIEPFTGVKDKTGQVIVIGPSVPFYEGLLPSFRGTPEPKSQFSVIKEAYQSVKEAIQMIAESWDIETLDDSGETSAENNSSTIILLAVDDNYLLFTGDAGILALREAVDRLETAGLDFSKIKFIQVPHHGSKRNIGPTLLDRLVGPKLNSDQKLRSAFVSVAKNGAPKHPSKKVVNAFRRRGVEVHSTAGSAKCHYYNAPGWPARSGWSASEPLPFYTQVED